jgi:hypothetical protein
MPLRVQHPRRHTMSRSATHQAGLALADPGSPRRNQAQGHLQLKTPNPTAPSRPTAGTALKRLSRGRKAALAAPPPQPTHRALAGHLLGHQPAASAAGGAPEGEAQGIAQELAALQGAGGWRQRRGHGQPAAAQGQAGQRPAAESTPKEAASGMDRRSSAEGLQGAADVLEQQHQMEGIRG